MTGCPLCDLARVEHTDWLIEQLEALSEHGP